jgi:hypothetical protein
MHEDLPRILVRELPSLKLYILLIICANLSFGLLQAGEAMAQEQALLRAGLFGAVRSAYNYELMALKRAAYPKMARPKDYVTYGNQKQIIHNSKENRPKRTRKVSLADLPLSKNSSYKHQNDSDLEQAGWLSF